ncbi:40S ribosomal protein S27 [Striga asiatica]|uniref:40S ribosomal protein S27 n=1 Tax=Striga asiatica TaxID=4170 RepID=A0A5A7QTH0_STRAF|nr:40S ribosomal protein S27 [Striga asiatica]
MRLQQATSVNPNHTQNLEKSEMESARENGIVCDANGKTNAPWTIATSWVVAHGSTQASVTVDSSDYPIDEPDPETAARNSPLLLNPSLPDSGPCEIKICFGQKYDVSQIYVRSTARVYEVYYAHHPNSSSEYLCTVKCGVAERDGIILQTSCIEDVGKEHSECLSGEITKDSVADGETSVSSEDEWVKIKVPEVESNSVPDKVNTNRMENVQDLYEATAQISDADPCSVLTIRLLSLQDKRNVYVDEIYVFADPVESTEAGNETVLAGSSTQSSLMAMFVPTLLQLSKSGAHHVQDKYSSVKGFKDNEMDAAGKGFGNNKMENGSKRNDESEVLSQINQVDKQYAKPKELEKDILKDPVTKYVEPVNMKDSPPVLLERALEQLISRVSRVEDICLRFEEKMMKPIESIEARLQMVEHQLQKLTDNTNHYALPRGTKICAPTFSYCESNSSSFNAEQSDLPASRASELETRGSLCNNMAKLTHDANFLPGLIVSAPEFPCEEDEEDFEPAKESPSVEPKKALSVDDALAAALNGFLSTAGIHPSDGQASSIFSGTVNEGNNQEDTGSITIEVQEFLSADNVNGDSLQNGHGFTCRAPEFIEEKNSNDEYLNYAPIPLGTDSEIKNDEHEGGVFGEKLSAHDFESESHIGLPAAFEENKVDGDFERDTVFSSVKTCIDAKPDLDKGSMEARKNRIDGIYDETNPGKTADSNPDDGDDLILRRGLGIASASISEDPEKHDKIPIVCDTSSPSMLDFEFPILEVKFTSDMSAITKTPLEALLGGAKESDTKVLSAADDYNDDGNTEHINGGVEDGNETTDLLPIKDLLIDTGVFSIADGLEDGSDRLCDSSTPQINASLI